MSEENPESVADQESLIEGRQSAPKKNTSVLVWFVLFKCSPWVIFAISGANSFMSFSMLLIEVVADLWVCRRTFSYELVGLSWSVETPAKGCQGIVTYHCEPDPFVPDALDSNVFWITMVANMSLFVLVTVASLLGLHLMQFLGLVFVDILEIVNLVLFFKCLGVSNRQSEQSFKSMMTGGGQVYQPQTFPNAVDIPLDQILLNEAKSDEMEEEEEKAEEEEAC